MLLARPKALQNEEQIIAALRQAGYAVTQVSLLPAELPQPAIVIVHLLSTLTDTRSIEGYVDFLHAYAKRKAKTDMRLVVLQPPIDKGPDKIVGYGTLVDAYLTEPFAMEMLLQFLARLKVETGF